MPLWAGITVVMSGTLHALELGLGDRPESGLAILSSPASLQGRFLSV